MKSVAIIEVPDSYRTAVYGIKEILEYPSSTSKSSDRFVVTILDPDSFQAAIWEKPDEFAFVVVPPNRLSDRDCVYLRDDAFLSSYKLAVEAGAVPVSVCAGAFFLCAAGFADGKTVTTHWSLAGRLAREFPAVTVVQDRVLVDEGSMITAGGITSYQDLSLYLLRKFASLDAATRTASAFLINPGDRSQLEYALRDLETARDPSVAEAMRFIYDKFREQLSLEAIASHCNVTVRTLLRRFAAEGTFTPAEYLQATRIAEARKLLENTTLPIKEVIFSCGYSDVSSFSRTFSRLVGLSPGEYRKRHFVG